MKIIIRTTWTCCYVITWVTTELSTRMILLEALFDIKDGKLSGNAGNRAS